MSDETPSKTDEIMEAANTVVNNVIKSMIDEGFSETEALRACAVQATAVNLSMMASAGMLDL